MKKLAALVLAGVLLLSIFFPPLGVEGETERSALPAENGEGNLDPEGAPQVTAPAAVLMEQSTGQLLYGKNAREQRPCASITKVMTLLLTFEAIEEGELQFDQMLSASAHAASMGGSDIWLEEGETMSVNDLMKATVIMSANDAAVVLAEAVAGSEEAFVARMNEKARLLGMEDTVFKNCNGLDEEGHVTSAYDVALMSRELMNHPRIFDYTLTWIDYLRDGATQLVNTNKLIKNYPGITGLKTGTTAGAGSCVSATAEREGMSLIAVVLGADSSEHRFSDAAAVLNYGFANFALLTPKLPKLEPLPVTGGMEKSVALRPEGTAKILVSVKQKGELETRLELEEALSAPVEEGDPAGNIVFSVGGEPVCKIPVRAAGSVEKITFSSAFRKILELYFS